MQSNRNAIPHYLVLRAGCAPYVLNAERHVLRREASLLLRAFARARCAPTSIADDAWDDFSGQESVSILERMDMRAYALVQGVESEHQLRLFSAL